MGTKKSEFYNSDSECDECGVQGVKMLGSVKVGPKGQVSIPKEVRDTFNINTGDTLLVFSKHDKAFGFIKADDMELFISYIQQEIEIIKEIAKKTN